MTTKYINQKLIELQDKINRYLLWEIIVLKIRCKIFEWPKIPGLNRHV